MCKYFSSNSKGKNQDFKPKDMDGYSELKNERDNLRDSNKEKDEIITDLKEEINVKTERIGNLEIALDKVKTELSRFKEFWRKLLKRFQIKVFDEHYDNIPEDKRSYTIVADDLINSGIFDDNDAKIKSIVSTLKRLQKKYLKIFQNKIRNMFKKNSTNSKKFYGLFILLE